MMTSAIEIGSDLRNRLVTYGSDAGEITSQQATFVGAAYREFAPPPHLRDFVVCYWRRETGARTVSRRVLPDGCIDVIWVANRAPFVTGPMTVAFQPTIEGANAIAGVRFRPGVAPTLLGVNASDLVDQDVPLRDLWPQRHHAPWERVEPEAPVAGTLATLTEAIAARIQSVREPDPFIMAATDWTVRNPSGLVTELGQLSGLSQRQVRRRFEQAIGYGPKMLQRIMRLQYLLWLASEAQTSSPGLARLAIQAGYADQPHMTREVAALTGVSPRRLLVDAGHGSAVSDLFKTP
jgi:AraC-like DNA-binding protein